MISDEKQNMIFFLGGYDAEMCEIREILDHNNLVFFDKNLSWGAKTSDYEKEINNLQENQIPVLIELTVDIELPSNAIVIDHHNEKSGADQKTSIEQVAYLLNIQLSRRQQLISINDKAYIDGMIDFGAAQVEIDDVRAFDRKCQGVTEKEEELSELSIKFYAQEIQPDGVLVLSLTEKTSPIVDRLYNYYRHIFINTIGRKFSYSGTGKVVKNFVNYFQELAKNDESVKCWYGGKLPFSGYFGSNTPITTKNIYEINEGIFK